MSEIELILTKLKIVSEEKEQGAYICDKEHSKILLDYIQQRDNIIKEVREYIDNDVEVYYVLDTRLNKAFDKTKKVKKDLLQILDKVEENKNGK